MSTYKEDMAKAFQLLHVGKASLLATRTSLKKAGSRGQSSRTVQGKRGTTVAMWMMTRMDLLTQREPSNQVYCKLYTVHLSNPMHNKIPTVILVCIKKTNLTTHSLKMHCSCVYASLE